MHLALRQACRLLCARPRKKKKNLFVCCCQVELCRDLVMSVWPCMHVCILGEITMGGCVFTVHGKIILLTVWKINDMSLSLPSSAEPGRGPCDPHGGALTQRQTSLKCPLTLAPVLTWFPPLFHFSFPHHYLLCSLVLLSDFPVLLTETECHTICRGMLRRECFITAPLGTVCGLAWLALSRHPPTRTHTI